MQPSSEEDLRCMRCDREAEAVITLTNFIPYYIEKYGYCPEHTPETDEEFDTLKQRIKTGDENQRRRSSSTRHAKTSSTTSATSRISLCSRALPVIL